MPEITSRRIPTHQATAPNVERRLLCFALFWHFLDIIWVWLFTIVYLMGVRP
jgi:heme/copper-type cytochrome/quinol oxidase subunit 3